MSSFLKILAASIALTFAGNVTAAPITYQGDLTATGQVNSQLEDEHWWRFSANAGDVLTITARRIEAALDPALSLFRGVASDTKSLTFLGFRDDNLSPNVYGGPFADPQFRNFGITTTGDYSLRIMSFLSNSAGYDNVYDYSINVEGSTAQVSEPATFGLMALSLMGLIGLHRKRSTS